MFPYVCEVVSHFPTHLKRRRSQTPISHCMKTRNSSLTAVLAACSLTETRARHLNYRNRAYVCVSVCVCKDIQLKGLLTE